MTAPFIASRALSAFVLLENVTKPKPCMQRSRQTDREIDINMQRAVNSTACNIQQVIKQHAPSAPAAAVGTTKNTTLTMSSV